MSTLHEVAVDGGTLTVGEWGPTHGPVVLAIHGISGTHKAWNAFARIVARGAPGIRVLAPDLRGRGRSSDLPGPYGMAAHARDLAAVLDHFGVEDAVVVGHSMGAFVTLVFAHTHSARVQRGLLIDGGLPIPTTPDATPEQLTAAILSPIEARLSAPVPSREGYHGAWKAHPAFAQATDDLREYIDYDLLERDGELWAAGNMEAIRFDGETLASDPDLLAALTVRSSGPVDAPPMTFLRAEAGMAVGAPPLYPEETARDLGAEFKVPVTTVSGVNHFTIVMGEVGARAIAAHLHA